jgi:signal peptidase II
MSLLLLVFALVFAADQASKWLVIASGAFHVVNSRRGWGSPAALRVRFAGWFVLAAAAAALAWRFDTVAVQAGAGAVAGGAAGNLIDAIRGRGVTDFIDLRVWPVFNLADVAIVTGTLLTAAQLIAG